MSVVALVPAAGEGRRLGAGKPKAFVEIAGVALVARAVRGLLESGCVDSVVVAAPVADVSAMRAVLADLDPVEVVAGGADRVESVALALDAALNRYPGIEFVLVHDAARAFTPTVVPQAVVRALKDGARAVIPVLPMADTVKQVDAGGRVAGTPNRADLRIVQTPQGFTVDMLRRAHSTAAEAGVITDDAGLVEYLGEPVDTVPGHAWALKVTTPVDVMIAERILAVEEPPA
ncbi:2-C-methyl-D-erythritol 4-phosphate cytidylyltransferase [Pseudonocardiaceae bacterium YIM PH 21723]|nr:2-C-methyl-D-erythritol 4-phosphate cytidylyltransferase [Pseudonocardiaceae bacterium YIM PH 21723]